uniref:Glucagon / GIP / secretin / VIP family domain-containing protein n=1 Tax=Pundamilia nyererei TaxID=303518 RepID=A0A3B4GZV8_9CICH
MRCCCYIPAPWHIANTSPCTKVQTNISFIAPSLKRHSDGTFTSDFTHYLDKIKAKDFVEWLTDPKQEG